MKYSTVVALALASKTYALRSCLEFLYIEDNARHAINNTALVSDVIQCKYEDGSDGPGPSCFYAASDFTLTTDGGESASQCPEEMPDSTDENQAYTIRIPNDDEPYPSLCLGVDGLYDGAPVVVQECTNPFENQLWTFTGNTLRQGGGFCLDVKDGVVEDGTKLQIWSCAGNSPNQHWVNEGPGFLQLPDNTFTLYGWNQCVDLTDGNKEVGTQAQLYFCDSNNSNQDWFLDTVLVN